jgi:hypothetical protein
MACEEVNGASVPTWTSDPTTVTIVAGVPTPVSLTMHHNGQVDVSINWETDAPTCQPSGATCTADGDCCAGSCSGGLCQHVPADGGAAGASGDGSGGEPGGGGGAAGGDTGGGGTAGSGGGAVGEDVTAPVLTALSLSPPTIDTRSADATVTVSFTATDDLSGLSDGEPVFVSPSGRQSRDCFGFPPTGSDGRMVSLTCSITFSAFGEGGIWTLQFFVSDRVGNNHNYDATELAALGLPSALTVNP